jgi:hypothetical protein
VDLSKPENAARAEALLAQSAEALKLIHQAVAMPTCDWQTDWSKGNDAHFPQYGKLRTCSRLLAFESEVRLHEGQVGDAVAACKDNFRLAAAANDPILIGPLTRYAISGIAFDSLTRVLEDGQPSAAAARAVASALTSLDPSAFYAEAMNGERALGLSIFDQVRSSPDPLRAIADFAGAEHPSRRLAGPHNQGVVRWLLASDETAYLDIMKRFIEAAAKSYRDVAHDPLFVGDPVDALPKDPPCVLTAILVPMYSRAQAIRDKAVAQLGLAQVALLLKAHRAEHGDYPKSLGKLAGPGGTPRPDDPFSGKPFVYQRQGAGFILYSWGSNLKDDGGAMPPQGKANEGDIVVKVTR